MASEAGYRRRLTDRIKERFPGCTVLANDPKRNQGIPDLLILDGDRWGMLEIKVSADAPVQPNQPYWVQKYNDQSFAAFIYPEIEDEVLDDLQSTFGASRKARISKPK